MWHLHSILFTTNKLIFLALNHCCSLKSPTLRKQWLKCAVCLCRWRTSLWRSRMAAPSATLSTTTTPVSCQMRLSVTAPLRLLSAHRGAAWSSTAHPATQITPLTPSLQAWTVLQQLCAVSIVQLSVWMHPLKKNLHMDVYTALAQHTDIHGALECGKRGIW